ncbi:hypothetical protein [Paenibacillus sp. MER TA 81-3]|uniref:hypothetical protein n=1 Tax=Paenibacillus sp. MER TA 81-3 TaxID=2939573 RepID=UPI0020422AEB|nr:hypothetical protein [Paenibacillus sp. MER TA 81-3]
MRERRDFGQWPTRLRLPDDVPPVFLCRPDHDMMMKEEYLKQRNVEALSGDCYEYEHE